MKKFQDVKRARKYSFDATLSGFVFSFTLIVLSVLYGITSGHQNFASFWILSLIGAFLVGGGAGLLGGWIALGASSMLLKVFKGNTRAVSVLAGLGIFVVVGIISFLFGTPRNGVWGWGIGALLLSLAYSVFLVWRINIFLSPQQGLLRRKEDV